MFDINKVDKEAELFIFDIYIAILKIKKVASKFDNGEDLLHSFTDWDSVIREFEIIGEASKYLLRDDLLESYYRRIVDFRNSITHEYLGIDQDIVWAIINQKLENIESVVLDLIQNIEPKLKQELIESFIEDNNYLDFVVEKLKEVKISPNIKESKMRLTNYEIKTIKQTFLDIFKSGSIYLFGSRVDNNRRGGDIDLYIQTDNNNIMIKKIKFLSTLKQLIGDQKIDLIISKDTTRIIEQEAIQNGIKL